MEEVGWPRIEPDLGFVRLRSDVAAAVQLRKTYVAYTRNANGEARLYINGEETAVGKIGGDLAAWGANLRLALGDEFVGDRGWLGTYHGVAIYNRALNASEIADHHAAGTPEHVDGLQVRYSFDQGKGPVIRDASGLRPALDLHVREAGAVTWTEDGLRTNHPVLIATQVPAQRLTTAVRESNAFTLEVWITPAREAQTGPARIVTLSQDHVPVISPWARRNAPARCGFAPRRPQPTDGLPYRLPPMSRRPSRRPGDQTAKARSSS